ncbi:MAG: xanthine dehydrogenase family protein molybdopterin-binding subunit, partial [Zwartia sp.]
MGHPGSSARIKPQGIGARVLRKEDHRHLQGTGNFVADMVMPGLSEVAFMRSPLAHARITSIVIPEASQSSVLTRTMLTDVLDITADSSLPTYQLSSHPPLASQKVRFVGEPVVMGYAATRAEAEDLLETVQVDY